MSTRGNSLCTIGVAFGLVTGLAPSARGDCSVVRCASTRPGADAGAKINAAIANLAATGGKVVADFEGAQTATATITVPANVWLELGPMTLSSAACPVIKVTGGSVRMSGYAASANLATATTTIINTGTCNTLEVNNPSLTAPAAPSLSQTVGGALAATTYFVKITYTNPFGETTVSAESSLAVLADNLLVVTSPAASGNATDYGVYVSTGTGTETKQAGAIALGVNWTEPTTGLVTGAAVPPTNTTGQIRGVRVENLNLNGNNTAAIGMFLNNSGNAVFDKVEILGHNSDGIQIASNIDTTIRNARITGGTGVLSAAFGVNILLGAPVSTTITMERLYISKYNTGLRDATGVNVLTLGNIYEDVTNGVQVSQNYFTAVSDYFEGNAGPFGAFNKAYIIDSGSVANLIGPQATLTTVDHTGVADKTRLNFVLPFSGVNSGRIAPLADNSTLGTNALTWNGFFRSATLQNNAGGSLAQLVFNSPGAVIAAPPSGATEDAGRTTSTITTTVAHGFVVGQMVVISSVTDPTFNGTFVIATVPTATTFTYANRAPAASATSGGGNADIQRGILALSGAAGQGITGSLANDLVFRTQTQKLMVSTDGGNTAAFVVNTDGTIQPKSVTFASLPAAANGSLMFCSDCAVAAACAGGGTGALAKRLNGAWVCN